uniref:Uncharacterized protein n=1 Tax=Candidatus Kentrum sp. SD TaxID=2126332 RepID=A0A451BRI8_9GAMM|nr:MAG: hypothetical protein BECKSD772D_GA0070982_11795 [Candidatus Kentron sp. SD]
MYNGAVRILHSRLQTCGRSLCGDIIADAGFPKSDAGVTEIDGRNMIKNGCDTE